jgi:flagellar hook-associated protein 3 FlgL
MRIGNNTMMERAMMDINANKVRMANTQRDISTGKRIHRGSDAPTAAARAAALRQTMAANASYAENVDRAREFLANTDSALTQLNDVLLRVRNIAINGASGHLQQSDKQVLATEVGELRELARMIGNTKDPQGRYLFGGLKTQTEPFPAADVTLGPNDAGTMAVEVAEGSTMTYNVTGVAVFGDTAIPATPPDLFPPSLYGMLDELASFLQAGTNDRSISDISLAKIDTQIDTLTRIRTDVGTRIQRLDIAKTRYEEMDLQLDGMLQDTEATDIVEASLRLNQYESAFQAALSVGARALPMSLVDFLR